MRAYAFAGRQDEARALLAEQEKGEPTLWNYYTVPSAYLALGEKEKAIQMLEEAYEVHCPWLWAIKVEYLYEPLRGDPRIQDLARRMGLPL